MSILDTAYQIALSEEKKETERKWVKVVRAVLQEGGANSTFNPNLTLGNSWDLYLEDGRMVTRPVRYTPQKGRVKRGWKHRRNSEDALPAPKKVLV